MLPNSLKAKIWSYVEKQNIVLIVANQIGLGNKNFEIFPTPSDVDT